MKPYYKDDWITIYNSDCIKGMEQLESGSFDMVLTDPPYMLLKQQFKRKRWTVAPKGSQLDNKSYKKAQLGYDCAWDFFENAEQYYDFIKKFVRVSSLLLRTNGHFVSFFDNTKIQKLDNLMQMFNIHSKKYLYMIKTNPFPATANRIFAYAVETASWGIKNFESKHAYTFNQEQGNIHPNHYSVAIPTTPKYRLRHPCEKPVKWNEWVLKYLTNEGDIVLEPFLGCGSTALACKNLSRKCVAFELNKEYCDASIQRLRQEKLF